jgi:hypothetical protein
MPASLIARGSHRPQHSLADDRRLRNPDSFVTEQPYRLLLGLRMLLHTLWPEWQRTFSRMVCWTALQPQKGSFLQLFSACSVCRV